MAINVISPFYLTDRLLAIQVAGNKALAAALRTMGRKGSARTAYCNLIAIVYLDRDVAGLQQRRR